MLVVYGIKNCDTVQRALKALDAAPASRSQFHDFKAAGLASVETAQDWIDALGVDVVVNRKGTTWRKLDDGDQRRPRRRPMPPRCWRASRRWSNGL
jgi:arsenate reductase